MSMAVVAQSAPPSLKPQSALERAPPVLVTALREVWARNPAVQAAEAQLALATAKADAAGRPIYNPELDINVENADVDTRSVGISQTIDWSGKRDARQTAASAEIRAAEAELDGTRQRIALDWLRGFTGFQVATEQAALGARRVGLLEQFSSLAERRFRAGDIPVLERDLAVLATQEARAQQAGLIAEQAKARQILIGVGGRSAALPPLPRSLPPAVDDAALDSSRLAALPALRRAQAETEAAQARVSMAERDRKADPTFSLTGGRVRNGPFNDRVIGVAVKIPLFVRNSYSAEVTAARSNVDVAAASQRDLALRAGAEAEQTGESYNALREAWLAWENSRVPSADERAVLLQKLWEAGEISASDYLVQLKQSLDTELTAAGLRARVWQAWTDWLAASGGVAAWLGSADITSTNSGELPR
jgi:cobalt-zinc-cadmium efflux system outer membrane protein